MQTERVLCVETIKIDIPIFKINKLIKLRWKDKLF